MNIGIALRYKYYYVLLGDCQAVRLSLLRRGAYVARASLCVSAHIEWSNN